MTDKRRCLTAQQRYALTKYLDSQSARILATRPHMVDVAVEASKALGFDVTETNVEFASSTIPLRWRAKAVAPKAQAETPLLDTGGTSSHDRVRPVAMAVVALADDLGWPIPNGEVVRRIASGKRFAE